MAIELDLQVASNCQPIPSQEQFQQWVALALQNRDDATLTIRLVDEEEMSQLNQTFRHKSGTTNVLSFPADVPDVVDTDLLGDIIICVPVIVKEANDQNKSVDAHWAHLTIHGTLHLLGYDHQTDEEANLMESLEVSLLKQLGLPNPYLIDVKENRKAHE